MTAVHTVVPDNALTDMPDRIVVAKGYGRVVFPEVTRFTSEGEVVSEGDVIAVVDGAEGRREVIAPCRGWIIDYLCREGQRVEPGAPIVHIRAA